MILDENERHQTQTVKRTTYFHTVPIHKDIYFHISYTKIDIPILTHREDTRLCLFYHILCKIFLIFQMCHTLFMGAVHAWSVKKNLKSLFLRQPFYLKLCSCFEITIIHLSIYIYTEISCSPTILLLVDFNSYLTTVFTRWKKGEKKHQVRWDTMFILFTGMIITLERS